MLELLIVVILILCFVLGFFVLVQKPKGTGLSGSMGSLGAQVMGVQKSGDTFEKGSWYIMTAIAALCIATTFMIPRAPKAPTEQEQTQTQTQTQQQQPAEGQPAPAPVAQ